MSILGKIGLSIAALLLGGLAMYIGAFAFGAGSTVQNWIINTQLALTLIAVGLIWWNQFWPATIAISLVILGLGVLLFLSR
jgi:hypothetical protein